MARDFWGEMHTRLLHLDTGITPIPEKHLQAVSAYTGLPWEVMPVKPERLLDAILQASEELNDER